MTTQISESIIINGQTYPLLTSPLDDYFEKTEYKPQIECETSALWRGYLGTWELRNQKLYLIDLWTTEDTANDRLFDRFLFNQAKECFAFWYTGELVVVLGDIDEYDAYEDSEKEFHLKVSDGIVEGSSIKTLSKVVSELETHESGERVMPLASAHFSKRQPKRYISHHLRRLMISLLTEIEIQGFDHIEIIECVVTCLIEMKKTLMSRTANDLLELHAQIKEKSSENQKERESWYKVMQSADVDWEAYRNDEVENDLDISELESNRELLISKSSKIATNLLADAQIIQFIAEKEVNSNKTKNIERVLNIFYGEQNFFDSDESEGDDKFRDVVKRMLEAGFNTPPQSYLRTPNVVDSPTFHNQSQDFNPNDRVVHAKFGQGTVISISKDRSDTTIEVSFRDFGIKHLLLRLANLSHL